MRHTILRWFALTLATVGVGCGLTEERFAEQMAELTCEAYEACGISVADSCVDETEDRWVSIVTNEGCDYDARAARSCYREAKDRDPNEREGCRIADGIDDCERICGTLGDSGR